MNIIGKCFISITDINDIKKDFNIEEFNNWFKYEFDGYDGRKGAEGIFLRTDKLSSEWVKQYLETIGQDTDFDNVQKYYDIVREEWLNLLNK